MVFCARFTLPVVLLAAIALAALVNATADISLILVPGLVAVICTATVLGQALKIRELLKKLPSLMKDTAWGRAETSFPTENTSDDLGQFTRDMRELASSMRDVFEQSTEMERLAHTDQLTNLPNRRGLNGVLSKLAADPRDGQGGIGLIHVDLDHFKAVNDRLGHDAGDYVLREAARMISTAIRDTDYLARVGGDEFVVVAPGIEKDSVLVSIAERIIEKFSEPIIYDIERCQVGVSIGMVLGGLRGKLLDPQRLVLNADTALCRAKSDGRNRYSMFSTTMARASRRQQNQAEEMRNGLDKNMFRAWFQPIFDIHSNRPSVIQICPKWESSTHGFIDADDFMATAETFNMAEEIGNRIFEQACRSKANWSAMHQDVPRLQFLLNRAQLLDPDLTDKVSWCFDDAGISPEDIAVGASEQNLHGRHAEMIFANLNRLRNLGCPIVLDDFGVENGSFSNLAKLRPSRIIVAEKLTEHLGHPTQSHQATTLLNAVVGGADALECTLAAKGLTEQVQVDVLRDVGVSEAFGPLWGAPQSRAQIGELLRQDDPDWSSLSGVSATG